MTGIVLGISTAWVWSTTSLLSKTLSARVGPLSFNAVRMLTASLFFLALLPFFGGWEAMMQLSDASRLALISGTIFGVTFGDTLYFWSMARIGASRALPISGIYPLFTWAMAVPLLGEPITAKALLGTVVVLVGLWLLAPASSPEVQVDARLNRAGVLGAIGAAVFWAVGTTALKFGLQDGVNVIVVNAFRLPLCALLLLAMVQFRRGSEAWRTYDRGNVPAFIALGIYSTGLGAILWTLAVEYAGAARAALLNTMSPLIGVPLSILFLRERVTPRVVLGVLCSVVGIVMIL